MPDKPILSILWHPDIPSNLQYHFITPCRKYHPIANKPSIATPLNITYCIPIKPSPQPQYITSSPLCLHHHTTPISPASIAQMATPHPHEILSKTPIYYAYRNIHIYYIMPCRPSLIQPITKPHEILIYYIIPECPHHRTSHISARLWHKCISIAP